MSITDLGPPSLPSFPSLYITKSAAWIKLHTLWILRDVYNVTLWDQKNDKQHVVRFELYSIRAFYNHEVTES
jgi:hypothetical protein